MKLSYENCKPLSKTAKPARRFRKRYAVIGFFALMSVIGNVVKEPTPATAAGASTGTRGMSDYEACLHNKQQLNELEAGLGDKSMNCEGVKAWKAPQERINAAGGRTALIRKCEDINKPLLKDPGSYRYDNATIAAGTDKLTVNVTYRAKNSFNAVVPGSFSCTFNG